MNRFSAADMTDARAKGYQDRVEHERYTPRSVAFDGNPAESIDDFRARLNEIAYRDSAVSVMVLAEDLRTILVAPVAAAPVDAEEDAYVIAQMGKLLAEIAVIVNGPEPAGTRWSYHDLPEKVRALASTPAATGIDRNGLHQVVRYARLAKFDTDGKRERWEVLCSQLHALIDASPKGGSEAVNHAAAALAHLSNALDDLQYSPDQRPVPLIREAMWHVQQMQATSAEVGLSQSEQSVSSSDTETL